MKQPLQALLMPPEYQEITLNGSKKISIREGFRSFQKDKPLIICWPKNSFCVEADCTDVRYAKAKEITPEELKADFYSNSEEMLRAMIGFYPKFSLESEVTIVRWDNVRGKLVDDYRLAINKSL
jgi:hypothetical protein